MNAALQSAVSDRGITRLCHFTPSRNLQHIAAGEVGILSTANLQDDERAVYNPTDLQRLDRQTGHICCSIEYPNAWYFEIARGKELLFTDWVVLLINPRYLWKEGALFCPRNAASNYGGLLKPGLDGFERMYANSVTGTGGHTRRRVPTHLACCPTDQQAEVLIPDCILLSDIVSVAVRSEEQARTERVRLEILGLDPDMFGFTIAPAFFSKHQLSAGITSGIRVPEKPFVAGGAI
ncbi:MAG: DUF4433 domain-containing protein [Phenylobacterium sp.]|uniref:DarT ssDNA thymidine ADP-ribosyltransferase family protein n=1 Tax=Phenylobacterium sp. TaxID=1871053 RepID=UPI001A22EA9A|nr:DarT ssDNA thymidine ADP-ribosyltransferase family protein [Phenylobacterium sp.]MBJ7411839.1 DUF4433 domain-containing protein [Phenylobacterium sp.]